MRSTVTQPRAARLVRQTVHVLFLLLVIGTLGAATSTTVAAAPPAAQDTPSTFLLSGEVGAGPFGGTTLFRHGDDVAMTVGDQGATGQVVIAAGTARVTIAANAGQPLVPGTFRAGAARGPDRAQVLVRQEGRFDGECARRNSELVVHDVDLAASRLWVQFVARCRVGDPAIVGEIRIGQPAASPDLVVGAASLRWPETRVATNGPSLPVWLVNTGSADLIVQDVTVVAGGTDFSVVADCATVAAGTSCPVYVRAVPVADGERAGVLRIQTSEGTHDVDLSVRGTAARSSWHMLSDREDFIGGGRGWSYPSPQTLVRADGTDTRISLRTEGWHAEFEAPDGQVLQAGTTYPGARRFPFNDGRTGLSVSGQSRGCNELGGSFTVHEATFDDDGDVASFAVTFVQHCEFEVAALRGSISWRATAEQPVPVTDPTVEGITLSADRSAYRYGSLAQLTVQAPAGNPVRRVTVYRQEAGTGEPQILAFGRLDGEDRFRVEVPMARNTVFTAAVGDPGDRQPIAPVAVTVPGAPSLAVSARRYDLRERPILTAGGLLRARARLAPARAGRCLDVEMQVRRRGSWHSAPSARCVRLDDRHRADVQLPLPRTRSRLRVRVRAVWHGDAVSTAASSPWRQAVVVDRAW